VIFRLDSNSDIEEFSVTANDGKKYKLPMVGVFTDQINAKVGENTNLRQLLFIHQYEN
jgi:hypothetical protein